jgi:hypothetical protein
VNLAIKPNTLTFLPCGAKVGMAEPTAQHQGNQQMKALLLLGVLVLSAFIGAAALTAYGVAALESLALVAAAVGVVSYGLTRLAVRESVSPSRTGHAHWMPLILVFAGVGWMYDATTVYPHVAAVLAIAGGALTTILNYWTLAFVAVKEVES